MLIHHFTSRPLPFSNSNHEPQDHDAPCHKWMIHIPCRNIQPRTNTLSFVASIWQFQATAPFYHSTVIFAAFNELTIKVVEAILHSYRVSEVVRCHMWTVSTKLKNFDVKLREMNIDWMILGGWGDIITSDRPSQNTGSDADTEFVSCWGLRIEIGWYVRPCEIDYKLNLTPQEEMSLGLTVRWEWVLLLRESWGDTENC